MLFDLDGVLIDSTRSVDRQWRAWAREKSVDEEKVMAIAHGVRSIEVIRAVAPHLDAPSEVLWLESHEAEDQDDVAVMPGAAKLLETIPNGCWGVVTSGTRYLATARLQLGGLPIPKDLVTADDVVNGKPDPEPYLKGAELMGANPADCLVIEDAPAGIRSAHAGGMKVIGLASTYTVAQLHEADAVVERLDQIRVAYDGARGLTITIDPSE